ncbi:MAG: hypothetical protein NWF03_05060 [Candidatus Bathyarchaeota archaeon]|nr:hypothetical protein [Candidatus Bathyarchaeota archaeon]
MNKNKEKPLQFGEGIFTALGIGFFLLLVGSIFVLTPNLFGKTVDFFQDFALVDVPNTDIVFPGPKSPDMHMTVYQAAGQASIAACAFQIVILALRFIIPSTWYKRAETVGNIVLWGGTAFLIQAYLIDSTQWFAYWSLILVISGVSLIARTIVMAVSRL